MKITESYSSRVIEFYDKIVVLECLIDKEKGLYEEHEFDREDFSNFTLEIVKLFKICWHRKDNQFIMEILDTPGLVLEEDFPKIDFHSEFAHIQLSKKK